MLACSTASLGALSLSGRGLGQYSESFCDYFNSQSQVFRDASPEAAAACAPGGNGNGNGNDTAMWGFLSSLVGAVPGMIHGAPPTAPPPLVQRPAARTGAVMLPLIAVGVVVWMFARAPARRS